MPKKADQLLENEELDVLQRLRDLAPPGYVCKVLRQEPGERQPRWLDNWSGDELPTEQQLREQYGGGIYVLELHNGDGGYIKGGRATIRIAGPPKATEGPGGGPDPTTRFAFEMLRDMQKSQLEARPKQEQNLPQLILAISAAVTALGGLLKPQGGGGSLAGQVADLRALVETVRELTPEPPAPNMSGEGGVFGAVVQGLNKLVELYASQQQGKLPGAPNPATEAEPTPGDAGPPPPADTTAPPPPVAGDWVPVFAPYVPQLVDAAQDDSDPELYADLVLDLCERKYPPALQFLAEKLATDTGTAALFQQQFLAAYPVTKPHAVWFGELFKSLRDALLERAQADADAAAQQPKPELVKEPTE
jgi:hypothetical protein